MSQEISQDKINSVAWEACNTFRGVVDASEYKNYILVFLFIKYLSDLRKDRMEQLQKEYDGNEERIKRALKRERFVLPSIVPMIIFIVSVTNPILGKLSIKRCTILKRTTKRSWMVCFGILTLIQQQLLVRQKTAIRD
jgi:type I restriction enzyme M protein